ncbi:sugar transferase [Rubellimicrobium thermophilum]|nr:sugar transferase [Rubellimicrobium thermophilum]
MLSNLATGGHPGLRPDPADVLRAAILPAAHGLYDRGLKRAFDLILALILLLPMLAVLLPLMLLVALDGHSPIYVQPRLGRGGRVFPMFKLRSMVPDAERALAAHLAADPQARAEWDRHQKLRHDPRVTRLGALLRRSSLDELPQIFNVLLGHMSFVGPRPMLPEQRMLYPGSEYFAMRPGITGLWQTSVRNESSFAERAGFDRRYFQTLSFATDLRLLLRTVRVVLRGTGC